MREQQLSKVATALAQDKGELTSLPSPSRAEPAQKQVLGMSGFLKVVSSAGGAHSQGLVQGFGPRCNMFSSAPQDLASCCRPVPPALSWLPLLLHLASAGLPLSQFLQSLPLLSPAGRYLSLHRGAGSMLQRCRSPLHTSGFFSFCYFLSILFHFTLTIAM